MAAPPPADWQPLFDGQTFAGWRGVGRDGVPAEHWVIEDGAIRKVASGAVPTAADGQPQVLITGGDAMKLAPLVSDSALLVPHLVLAGIVLAGETE